MTRLVTEAFAVDEKDVILSQTPETTIGAGLALYNVLKLRNEARRARLRTTRRPRPGNSGPPSPAGSTGSPTRRPAPSSPS